jgi:hypothetical protein
MRLDRVDGDPTGMDQTPYTQGIFFVPDTGGPTCYQYVPLTDAFGQAATVSLDGVQTLRLTAMDANDDVQLNFLVFASAETAGLPTVATASLAPNASAVPTNAVVDIAIANGCSSVRGGSVILKFDGVDVTVDATITTAPYGVTIHYSPRKLLEMGSSHAVSLAFADDSTPANLISRQWSFTVTSPSALVLSEPRYVNGTFSFSFDSKVGTTYTVEYKSALGNATEPWHFLQDTPGTGTRVTINDAVGAGRSRFYQVRVQ